MEAGATVKKRNRTSTKNMTDALSLSVLVEDSLLLLAEKEGVCVAETSHPWRCGESSVNSVKVYF